MDFEILYSEERDVFIVRTSGPMTGAGFVAMGQALLDHDQFSAGRNVIFDHTDLDFSHTALSDLRKARMFHAENVNAIGDGKSAIVVNLGLIDMWNALWSKGEKIKTGNQTRVFDSFEEAVVWTLGLNG
jgi:hypothetical protein